MEIDKPGGSAVQILSFILGRFAIKEPYDLQIQAIRMLQEE